MDISPARTKAPQRNQLFARALLGESQSSTASSDRLTALLAHSSRSFSSFGYRVTHRKKRLDRSRTPGVGVDDRFMKFSRNGRRTFLKSSSRTKLWDGARRKSRLPRFLFRFIFFYWRSNVNVFTIPETLKNSKVLPVIKDALNL